MEKYLSIVLVAVFVASEVVAQTSSDWRVYNSTPWKERCSENHAKERNKVIEETFCHEPQLVYVKLSAKLSNHELITPFEVMAKRCIGVCDFQREGSCFPTKLKVTYVQVKIYNSETNKEACAAFHVVEHMACACRLGPDLMTPLIDPNPPPNIQ